MNTEFIFEFEFYDLFNGKIPEYTILTLKTLTNCSLGPRKDIVAIWNTRIIIILYNIILFCLMIIIKSHRCPWF